MRRSLIGFGLASVFLLFHVVAAAQSPPQATPRASQSEERFPPSLKTPLSQHVLDILANELSGQIAFNNEVLLAGAPWVRSEEELSGTFYEAQKLYDLAKGYAPDNVRFLRYDRERKSNYPLEAELWLVEPHETLIARLDADAALVASGSADTDLTADLVYVPPLSEEQAEEWAKAGPRDELQGKVGLMWSHPSRATSRALEAAGLAGSISFSSRDRYTDPDQVVYSRGGFAGNKNLTFGLTVSWRQWSELLEDLERGGNLTVRCRIRNTEFPDRLEGVLAAIPGTEPGGKGILFMAHLFEGYVKRGANDNMSGCAAELEIFRALTKLVASGALPQPRRTISFLWINEISGTYEYISRNPGIADTVSTVINMDMVGEALRKNNALFTMTMCAFHLPSYLDGLGHSVMNYLWRTNDIVYANDSPRNNRGQIFPWPLWEKNGSRDAFRFLIHDPTGGSDHTCFNNFSVGIPAVELNIWPDQWYHADTDTPDKSDPTQLRRTAFVGAAMAWAAAHCTDDVLAGLAKAVTDFGYSRLAGHELPDIFRIIDAAEEKELSSALGSALNLAAFGIARESGAVETLRDIASGSPEAGRIVSGALEQMTLYGEALRAQVEEYASRRARRLGLGRPSPPKPTSLEIKYAKVFPAVHPSKKGKEFSVERSESHREYTKAHPDFMKELGLTYEEQRTLLDYVNGRRSVIQVRNWASAELRTDLSLEKVVRYFEFLEDIGWLVFE